MSDNNNSGSNRNNNRGASAKANAGAGKNAAEKAAENAAAKAKRRTRKQKLINELTRLRKIRNTGQKYRGKKGINATIKNFENALNAEEAKLRNAAKKKENAAAEREAAKARRNSERRGRSASVSSVRSVAKFKMPTKAEMASLSRNEILARMASIVNAAKVAAVVNTGLKAARAEAKEIVKEAKARYDACKASCKVPYDEEYARAKAIVARAEGE
jgi:hypothetical protein